MNSLDSIRELFQHMQWADSEIWRAVFATSNAATDTVLRDRLQHIHLVQQAFFHIWRGKTFDYQAASASHTEMITIAQWARQYHTEAPGFLDTLDEAMLERSVTLPWAAMIASQLGREIVAPTLNQTLLQVAMHSSHHRGQVSSRLRELGVAPPMTDFIVWVWTGKPHPEWPDLYGNV